jgi:AcrR family transcriptional regulator
MNDTRRSLLESACEVFAEKGFQDASVAAICKQAKANIASINYHFGGKKKLYLEVLKYCADYAEGEYPLQCDREQVPNPEDRLAQFIRAQFLRSHCNGLASCFDRIVVHEVTNPSFAHEVLFGDIIRKRRGYLIELLRELLPPNTSDAHLRVCMHNLVSLFAFQKFARVRREQHKRMKRHPLPPPEEMSRFAIMFALGGIQAIAEVAQQDGEPSRKRSGSRK